MRKIILFVLAVAAIAITSGLQAQHEAPHATIGFDRHEPTAAQIDSMVRVIRAANKSITNPNFVRFGQWVTVPTPAGDRYFQFHDWKLKQRVQDCLITLSRSYLRGDLDPTVLVADTTKASANQDSLRQDSLNAAKARQDSLEAAAAAKAAKYYNLLWLWWCVVLLGVALLWWLIYYLRNGQSFRWMYPKDDLRRHLPIFYLGLPADQAGRIDQISRGYPDVARVGIASVEAGSIRGPNGVTSTVVEMVFADGAGGRVQRRVRIPNGMRAARATLKDGSTRIYRWACVNGIVSDNFGLPRGWEFVPDAAAPAPTQAGPKTEDPAKEKPKEISAEELRTAREDALKAIQGLLESAGIAKERAKALVDLIDAGERMGIKYSFGDGKGQLGSVFTEAVASLLLPPSRSDKNVPADGVYTVTFEELDPADPNKVLKAYRAKSNGGRFFKKVTINMDGSMTAEF